MDFNAGMNNLKQISTNYNKGTISAKTDDKQKGKTSFSPEFPPEMEYYSSSKSLSSNTQFNVYKKGVAGSDTRVNVKVDFIAGEADFREGVNGSNPQLFVRPNSRVTLKDSVGNFYEISGGSKGTLVNLTELINAGPEERSKFQECVKFLNKLKKEDNPYRELLQKKMSKLPVRA